MSVYGDLLLSVDTAEQAHRYFMTFQSPTQGCTQVANGNGTQSYKGGAIG